MPHLSTEVDFAWSLINEYPILPGLHSRLGSPSVPLDLAPVILNPSAVGTGNVAADTILGYIRQLSLPFLQEPGDGLR